MCKSAGSETCQKATACQNRVQKRWERNLPECDRVREPCARVLREQKPTVCENRMKRVCCGNTSKKTPCAAAKVLKRSKNNNVAVAWVTTKRSRNGHPCCNAETAPKKKNKKEKVRANLRAAIEKVKKKSASAGASIVLQRRWSSLLKARIFLSFTVHRHSGQKRYEQTSIYRAMPFRLQLFLRADLRRAAMVCSADSNVLQTTLLIHPQQTPFSSRTRQE